jgi:hypothetical protein
MEHFIQRYKILTFDIKDYNVVERSIKKIIKSMKKIEKIWQ